MRSYTKTSLIKYTYLFLPILLNGCSTSVEQTPSPAPPIEISTTDLTARLSAHFIKEPATQPEKDQNALVGYAIDKNLDVKRTASGMYYVILIEGNGPSPTATSKIKAHYEGKLLDGTVFDSSYKRGKPLAFKLNQVIRGWQEALQLLQPGGKGIFLIPSRIAYGVDGFGPEIPPHTPLIFTVELLEIK